MKRLIIALLAALSVTLSAQQPITTSSPDGQPVIVSYETPALPPTCLPASGSAFPVGDTTVTCSAGTVTFTVTVTPPAVPVAFDPDRDLIYSCAFRMPSPLPLGTQLMYNGAGLAFRPTASGGSLFINGKYQDEPQKVLEISIPPCTNNDRTLPIPSLPRATLLQPAKDPTEGGWQIPRTETGTPTKIGGLLVINGKLCGSLFGYYDGSGKQVHSHFCRPLNLLETGQVQGLVELVSQPPITDTINTYRAARFTNSYMCEVPTTWQGLIGGTVCVGADPSTISGTSTNGPSLFGWTSSNIINGQTITPTIWYSQQKPLNPWNVTSVLWNGTSQTAGAFFVGDSFLTVYKIGVGNYCYGLTTYDITKDNTFNANGVRLCYDPASGPNVKGGHAYPYEARMMAFARTDLEKVRAGTLKPYQVRPYHSWTIDVPYLRAGRDMGGFALDRATGTAFISIPGADENAPIITVWTIKGVQ